MKILLVLLRTLGDVILGSTLVAELKKKYPDCEITWAVWPDYVQLIDVNPDVRGMIITDKHDVILKEMCSDRYDQVLVPAQLTHTDTFWHQNIKYKDAHLVDFYAGRCGIEITDRRTYMFPSEADWDRANSIVTDKEKPVIVIHTMSRVPSKDWHLFGEFVEALREKYDDPQLIQVGGPEDTKCGVDDDLRGRLTYNEIAALLSMSDLFVGVDSGLAYIADSMECPTICIMGMSTGSTSGPISGRVTFIEPDRPEGCEWPCHSNCHVGKPCIQSITVEEVIKHVQEKIEERQHVGSGPQGDAGSDGAGAAGKGGSSDGKGTDTKG